MQAHKYVQNNLYSNNFKDSGARERLDWGANGLEYIIHTNSVASQYLF